MNLVIIDGMHIHTDNTLRVGRRIHGTGTITKTHASLQPEKLMCVGCYDDFYNRQVKGGCWLFKNAKVVNKVGYSSIHCANGPDTIMKNTLFCWHAVSK